MENKQEEQPTTAMEYLALLKLKHAEWDKLLKAEQERPQPDAFLMAQYKKHKLSIKDEIQQLEQMLLK